MDDIAWSRDGSLRTATLGEHQGHVVSAGSRWVWKVGDLSDITDDERVAVGRVEELLADAAANDPAPAPLDAPPPTPAPAASPVAAGGVERWEVDPWIYQTEREHVRRTHLELLLESPKIYEHHVVLGNPITDTKPLRLGRALHVEVLQPEETSRLLVVEPEFNKRTKAGKQDHLRWRAQLAPGAIVLKPEELQTVRLMARALRDDSVAGPLLSRDGWRELPLRWIDAATGLPCKVMLDLAFETASRDRVRVLDLKSSEDPSDDAWPRSVATFGYHRQDAMYRGAAERFFGRPVDFVFIVVRNKHPFEVAVYDLEEQDVELGRRQIRALLDRLARHIKTGDWSAPWQCRDFRPKRLSLPAYARKEITP